MKHRIFQIALVTLACGALFAGCGNKKPPIPPTSLIETPAVHLR